MDDKELETALLTIARALRELEFQMDNQYKALRCMLNAMDEINNKISRLTKD